jgi:hypothetical protein
VTLADMGATAPRSTSSAAYAVDLRKTCGSGQATVTP